MMKGEPGSNPKGIEKRGRGIGGKKGHVVFRFKRRKTERA